MSMDCLSYYFDWDPPIQLQDCFIPNLDMILPETDSFFLQPQPQFHQPLFQQDAPPSQSLLELNHLDDQFLLPQETFLTNPITETHNFPSPKRQKLVNSNFHDPNDHQFLLPQETFLTSPKPETYNFPSPKRQKLVNSNFFDPYDNLNLVPEASTFPDFSFEFNVGRGDHVDDTKKPTLSSQSIAARERRRRIAEKTHELGKLIPGGHKLNTAEMFQAAAKYVKFLQSQVGILQLMQQTHGSSNVQIDTRRLLESRAIQEKLSTEEVCLVPSDMVQAMTTEKSVGRNLKIFQEVNKLPSTDLAN